MTAGAWYVAIDFQLHIVLIALLWACGLFTVNQPRFWLIPTFIVGAGVTVSLLYFNRDASWDIWAPYFFGSYGLGVLAYWAGDPARSRRAMMLVLAIMLFPAMLGLALEFRTRIAVAVVVACVLVCAGRASLAGISKKLCIVSQSGARISYAVFLVHFPVCLVINAAFTRFMPATPYWQLMGIVLAWLASLMAGVMFQRWVERPLNHMFAWRKQGYRGRKDKLSTSFWQEV